MTLFFMIVLFEWILLCKSVEIRLINSVDELNMHKGTMNNPLINNIHLRELFERAQTEINTELSRKSMKRSVNDLTGTTKLVLTIGASKGSQIVNKQANVALRASKLLLNLEKKAKTDSTTITYNPTTLSSSYGNNSTGSYYQMSADYNSYLSQYQAPLEFCPNVEKPFCDFNYPYRTMDGSCNNRKNVWWGKKETPFKRLLYPSYDDGLDVPRFKSITGNRLKNPRLIALHVHTPVDRLIQSTNLVPTFGQFIDHDLSLTALISDENGNPIKCFCNNEDTDCINIEMPNNDRYNLDQRCMVTPRSSASYKTFDCNLGAREQLNLLTHWLDLSQTYGNDLEKNLNLRKLYGGLLRSSVIRGINRPYLPFNKKGRCFGNRKKGHICFETGDPRSNQNLLLISMQTIWMREHNRLARKLSIINPYWNDEKLFQEARKINIAQYQHIVYNEWLPIVLGEYVIKLYGLKPLNQGFLYNYNEDIYPNIANEFATAAFRFGHSLVRSFVHKLDNDYKFMRNLTINEIVMNSLHAFKRGGLDSLARGCVMDDSYAFDVHINSQLNNHLFEEKIADIPTHRFSLSALNINRGRDHGLQSYNFYRELCGLNRAYTFDDLYNVPEEIRVKLSDVYEHVDDIDLFTGATSEIPVSGGLVGPTFACILAKQFRDLKFGDRFYYENGEYHSYGFTIEQLDQIRKANMARVFCDNVDVKFMQKNPFLNPNPELNPLISCSKLPHISMRPWQQIY